MPRPVIAEALELLRATCDDAPEGEWDADLIGAWSGALRGVPDETVLEGAGSWEGAWPSLSEFLTHLGQRTSTGRGPSPARQEQMRLSSAERKERALARIQAIRDELAAKRKVCC